MNILRSLRRRLIDAPRGFGHPVPAAAFDAEYRTGQWNLLDSPDEKDRYTVIAGLVRKYGSPQPRLLDAGCGGGRLATEFTSGELACYHGVDLSSEAIGRARLSAPPGAMLAQGDLETWTPPARYDVIVVNEVAGYFHDPAKTLRRLASSLEPGGTLLVSLYRWGHHEAIWRRIEAHFASLHRAAATSPAGDKIWDIRLFRLGEAHLPPSR